MAQRHSGYPREPGEKYFTPRAPVAALASWLRRHGARRILDVDHADDTLARHFEALGFAAVRSRGDFFALTPSTCPTADAVCINPPYGVDRGGRLACGFLRHALTLRVPIIAALATVDFDSALSRVDMFRDEPRFAGRLVLLERVVWFARAGAKPSTNHVWLLWREGHRGGPRIFYPDNPPSAAASLEAEAAA